MGLINLVPRSPRSLVDEAEGEIWQSKKICFSRLAAPFDSCPIPSLTIDVFFHVLARFGDNNWEKGEDFVKTFYVKKLVWEMEGSLSARALDDV